jgi:hypothetical protein
MSMTPTTPQSPFSQGLQTAKSFWERPEGAWGKGAIVLIGTLTVGALLYFWSVVAAFLTGMLSDTLHCVELVIMIGALTSPVWCTPVRQLCRNAFQMAIRWGYQALIAKDPIGVLRNNVLELNKEAQTFDASVAQLSGSKQNIENDIQQQIQLIQRNGNLEQAAMRKVGQMQQQMATLKGNDRQQMALDIQDIQLTMQGYEQEAGIAKRTIDAEKPLLDQTNEMYDRMCRLRMLAQFKVKSLSRQADMYSKQRATILAGQKALGSARRIIHGDPQQLEMVNMTIEYLNEETANTIGAMKDFNRDSGKYLTDMDIQNDADATAARKIFGQLEQKLALPDPLSGELPPIETSQDATGAYVPATTSSLPDSTGDATDWSKLLK